MVCIIQANEIKKKKRERKKDDSPRTEHQDHLHQKSYGGPPIHRVIQFLIITNITYK